MNGVFDLIVDIGVRELRGKVMPESVGDMAEELAKIFSKKADEELERGEIIDEEDLLTEAWDFLQVSENLLLLLFMTKLREDSVLREEMGFAKILIYREMSQEGELWAVRGGIPLARAFERMLTRVPRYARRRDLVSMCLRAGGVTRDLARRVPIAMNAIRHDLPRPDLIEFLEELAGVMEDWAVRFDMGLE